MSIPRRSHKFLPRFAPEATPVLLLFHYVQSDFPRQTLALGLTLTLSGVAGKFICAYRNELRGTGSAFYALLTDTFWAGLGPVLVALVFDHLYGDGNLMGRGLDTVPGVSCTLAALLLACGIRAILEAVTLAEP